MRSNPRHALWPFALALSCGPGAEPSVPDWFPPGEWSGPFLAELETVDGEGSDAELGTAEFTLSAELALVYFTEEETVAWCTPDEETGLHPYEDLCGYVGPGFTFEVAPGLLYADHPGGLVQGVATGLELLGWYDLRLVEETRMVVPPEEDDDAGATAAPTQAPEEPAPSPTPGEDPTPEPTPEPTPQDVICIRTVNHRVYAQQTAQTSLATLVQVVDTRNCTATDGDVLPTLYRRIGYEATGTLTAP